jgi:glycerol-3-phosphate acyltransferase PlsY
MEKLIQGLPLAPTHRTFVRTFIHIGSGLGCAALVFFLPDKVSLVALLVFFLVFGVLELLRLRGYPAVLRVYVNFAREQEAGRLTGAFYFFLGCLLTALLFPAPIAALAILYLSLGDPAATLVGGWIGKTRIWGKSLEGLLACLGVCAAAGMAVSGLGRTPLMLVALAGAATAGLLEVLPLKINDNLTIPLGSALVMGAMGLLFV